MNQQTGRNPLNSISQQNAQKEWAYVLEANTDMHRPTQQGGVPKPLENFNVDNLSILKIGKMNIRKIIKSEINYLCILGENIRNSVAKM